jgi:hypothetical protein
MADDKIVTKKTAAKKAVARKTTAKKTSTAAETQSTPAPTVSEAIEPSTSKKTTARKSTAPRKTTASETSSKPAKATEAAAAPATAKRSEHRGSLLQLATVSPAKRLDMIREAAYYKAEKRNFAPGHEAEDWALAEREIDELIARAKVMTGG